MPQLISVASQSSPKFDTLVASQFDLGNIQEAFIFYHYGVKDKGDVPAEKSINSYFKNIKESIIEKEPVVQNLLDTYNILEDFYSSSSGSIENISDTTILNTSASVLNNSASVLSTSASILSSSLESFKNIDTEIKNYPAIINDGKNLIYESFNNQTSSYTIQLTDNNKIVILESSISLNITIPNDSNVNFPVGSNLEIVNIGSGSAQILGQSGVTLRGANRVFETISFRRNQAKAIYKRSSNDWVIVQ